MRPRSRTITRRAMLTTVLMGATAALLTEAAAAGTGDDVGHGGARLSRPPSRAATYVVTFLTTQTNPADVKIYEDLAARIQRHGPGRSRSRSRLSPAPTSTRSC